MPINDDNKIALLASVSNMGRDVAMSIAADDAEAARIKEIKGAASVDLAEHEWATSGFSTRRYVGLGNVARAVAAATNGEDEGETRALCVAAARAFDVTSGGDGAKDRNASVSVMAGLIGLGGDYARVQRFLADVLNDYKARAAKPTGDTPAEQAAAKAEAERFFKLGKGIKVDHVKGTTSGHNGRPSRTVNGIFIEARAGTTRDSQFAEIARAYVQHGNGALDAEYVAAVLDNGGKAKHQADLKEHLMRAEIALAGMLAHGGEDSADVLGIKAALALVARVGASGFAPPRQGGLDLSPVAPVTPPPLPVAVETPPPLPVAPEKKKRAGIA